MNVKAYALLTGHGAQPNSLWPDLRDAIKPEFAGKRNVYLSHLPPEAIDEVWKRFRYALRPLQEAGKLGAVLMQYPEWFTAKRDNRAELAAIRERWADLPVCVEFRSPTWLATPEDRDRTLGTLSDHDLALVVVDAPRSSKLSTVVEVTNPQLAVVRFHGRNDDTWKRLRHQRGGALQIPLLETPVAGLGAEAREPGGPGREVHALMNNCYQDYGVRNAADLSALLED